MPPVLPELPAPLLMELELPEPLMLPLLPAALEALVEPGVTPALLVPPTAPVLLLVAGCAEPIEALPPPPLPSLRPDWSLPMLEPSRPMSRPLPSPDF
jgi:hypothetical protein